ncbi:MAG: 30S ribosomal protein S5 [Thermoplasmata archaeon]|nr:30S ribosomal protein S5 [Thermoplasmata archaeon]
MNEEEKIKETGVSEEKASGTKEKSAAKDTAEGTEETTQDGKESAGEEEKPKEDIGPANKETTKIPDLEEKGVDRYWTPLTKLGRMVREGKITNMEDVLNSGLVLREPEIVDILLGEIQDEVIDVNMVQRMTDSGRRIRFAVTVAVGNGDGYLGLGRAHGKEVGPTIRKAIDNAKLNIFPLKRGCGSWECGCGTPHSIPYRTSGKAGSVKVTFMPAPRGVGLAAGDVAKKILKLGGIKDLWATTKGQTQTTINYAMAVNAALLNLSKMKINKRQQERFRIIAGGVEE